MTDSMQNLADEVAAWAGTGAAVISGARAMPVTSVYANRPQVRDGIACACHLPYQAQKEELGSVGSVPIS